MSQGIRLRGLTAAGALLLGFAALSALLAWGTSGALFAVRAPGSAPLDAGVALTAALAGWLVLGWLVAGTVATLATAALAGLGSRAHTRALAVTPPAARRLAGALLGLTLAATPLAAGLPAGAAEHPAVATAGSAAGGGTDSGAGPAVDLDRPAATAPAGWSPDRPAAPRRRTDTGDAAVRLVATTPHAEHRVLDEVVVRRGDSLWDIAARHLGAGASAAEVAAEWPRWYAANRHLVGADPDLLLPGQRLVPPA